MHARCYNPKSNRYYRYGGRGIVVCERWHAFENFLADVGQIPEDKSLDRIDNNGNYKPENVRLVDMKAQQNNRSNNINKD